MRDPLIVFRIVGIKIPDTSAAHTSDMIVRHGIPVKEAEVASRHLSDHSFLAQIVQISVYRRK